MPVSRSPKSKIAFVAPFGVRPKGTVSARMLPMAQALARRGHSIRIVVPPWDDPDAPRRLSVSDITPEGAEGSVELITLPVSSRALGGVNLTVGLVRGALGAAGASGWKPDIAHVFKPIGYSGLAGLALGALRIRWVLDVDDWEGPGGWTDVNPYSSAQKLAIAVMEAGLPRVSGTVTAASKALEARTWDMGLPRSRVFYVPNGVSVDKYGGWAEAGERRARDMRERLGVGSGPVLLLYSRLAEFPYRWSLDVLRSVHSAYPEAHLLVVGSGFFGEEERLRREAGKMGLGGRVIVTGRVPEEDLPAYLALADVALYPMADSLINRAKSPVKVLEPMLMGLPVVGHRVGQAAEFIGDAGVLVDAGDVEGMARAVVGLLGDDALRAELGRKARERVWARLGWHQLCLDVEKAYRMAMLPNRR